MGVLFGNPLAAGVRRAADLRLAVQICTADLAVLASDHLLPVHRRLVQRHQQFVERSWTTPAARPAPSPGRRYSSGRVRHAVPAVPGRGRADGRHLAPHRARVRVANIGVAFLGRASANLNYTASRPPFGPR